MNAAQTFTQGSAGSILGAEPFPTTTFSLDIPCWRRDPGGQVP